MSRLGNIGGRLYRGEVSVNFVGRQKLWYAISGAILVISIAALVFRGLNYSVDFKGGSVISFPSATATTQQVTSAAANAGAPAGFAVEDVHGTTQSFQIRTAKLSYQQSQNIANKLARDFNLSPSKVSVQYIGPSWGSQISQKALEALIAFLIVIVAYLSIAFEWKMAVAAFTALLHDIVITVGVYALTGFEVSPATIIGLLTILGYSLYDTVVVFDKVRENTAGLLGTRRTTYSEAANLALNQTLVRSINTSVIALLPVLAILVVSVGLLGNGELKDLSLVLFVGMLSGTYSSICIATPVLADLKEREQPYRQLARQVALRAAGGRAALRRQARAAAGGTAGGENGPGQGAEPAGPAVEQAGVISDTVPGAGDQDDAVPGGTGPGEFAAGDESTADEDRVPAGRTAAGGTPPARSGPRQQPRRTSAAKRRPGGKKKRR
jgi:preprotein translocase subunit SecF